MYSSFFCNWNKLLNQIYIANFYFQGLFSVLKSIIWRDFVYDQMPKIFLFKTFFALKLCCHPDYEPLNSILLSHKYTFIINYKHDMKTNLDNLLPYHNRI